MAANDAIMGDMSLGHEQIVASDAGNPAALDRSPAHRDTFAKYIAIAYVEAGSLASILQILRVSADAAKGMKDVRAAQTGRAVYDSMGVKNTILTQFHIVGDNRIGSNANSGG